ncbi:MAG: NAD(P)-dependent oxidoreductase [Bacteroidota bacterium]
MKVLVYSTKDFEIPFLKAANHGSQHLEFTKERLSSKTAQMAVGFEAISIFSADDASPLVLEKLRDFGVKFISLRSAGHDNINVRIANSYKIRVANAPEYSPNAIAEHAVALLLALNRKIILAHEQIKNHNFSLDRLIGFDLKDKTVGILGTGRIGSVIARIMHGFGCRIIANDTSININLQKQYGVEYISKDALCKEADVLFIGLPLTSVTHYLVDEGFLQKLSKEVLIVNIARGAIVKTNDLLKALNEHRIGGYATDVYEKEAGIFFYDHSSGKIPKDPLLKALIDHPKVLLTPHQAFATKEAIRKIAEVTLYNLNCWESGMVSLNELS